MDGGIVPLSLTTMDALIVMMWEYTVSQVTIRFWWAPYLVMKQFIIILIIMCTASCFDGQIKLIGGYSERNGHVEICSNQRWETLSLSDWKDNEAKVACNSLGYSYGMFIQE